MKKLFVMLVIAVGFVFFSLNAEAKGPANGNYYKAAAKVAKKKAADSTPWFHSRNKGKNQRTGCQRR